MTSPLRVVLLGSTGLIGRAVVRRAELRPADSVVLQALVRGDASRLSSSVAQPFVGHLRELPRELFFEEPHVVVHCATVQRAGQGQGFDANAAAIPPLMSRVPPSCRGVIYCSSASVYGQGPHLGVSEAEVHPATPLAMSRLATERALRRETESRAMALCILRPRFIIGRGDRSTLPAWARLFRRGVMVGSGAQQLSVIHVNDYADLILTIAEAMAGPATTGLPRAQVFNVAYRQPLRLAEIREAFGRQRPLRRTWFKVPVSAPVLRTLRAWPLPSLAALAVKLELTGLSQVLDVSSLERAWGSSIPSKDPQRALTAALAEMEDVP